MAITEVGMPSAPILTYDSGVYAAPDSGYPRAKGGVTQPVETRSFRVGAVRTNPALSPDKMISALGDGQSTRITAIRETSLCDWERRGPEESKPAPNG
jgi:hypothetical protein